MRVPRRPSKTSKGTPAQPPAKHIGSSDTESGNANNGDGYDRAMDTSHGDQSQTLVLLLQDEMTNGLDGESEGSEELQIKSVECTQLV